MAKKSAKQSENTSITLAIPEMEQVPLIVCGSGKNWQEQLENISGKFDLMLVNSAGISYPKNFKYWASWTPNYFKAAEEIRIGYGFNCSYTKITQFPQEDCTEVPVLISGGGSGLYAVLAGLKLGYSKIIVVGINLLSPENKVYRKGWEKHLSELHGKVKGVSGYPKELLGYPTQKWLEEISNPIGKN